MQSIPICFNCDEPVAASDAAFEAPCGHDEHATAVWHGLCLMDWRDNRENAMKRMRVIVVDMEEFMRDIMGDEN